MNPAPLLPKWEKGLGDEGGFAKLGCTPIWILWRPMLFRDLKLTELAGAVRLPINSVHQKKQRAIAAYRSQCQSIADSTHTILPKDFLRRFLVPYEVFSKPILFSLLVGNCFRGTESKKLGTPPDPLTVQPE